MLPIQLTFPMPENHLSPGGFGAHRLHDIHTGVDLYAKHGTPVVAITDGRVVAVIENFTGPAANSPWWHKTSAVMVEDYYGVWLYGEVTTTLKVGEFVKEGELVGHVERVLRNDKGKPTAMLHVERYVSGTKKPCDVWHHGERCPVGLVDPMVLLSFELGMEACRATCIFQHCNL